MGLHLHLLLLAGNGGTLLDWFSDSKVRHHELLRSFPFFRNGHSPAPDRRYIHQGAQTGKLRSFGAPDVSPARTKPQAPRMLGCAIYWAMGRIRSLHQLCRVK